MKRDSSFLFFCAALLLAPVASAADYYPDRHHWEHRDPAAAGFDPERLEAAIEYAREAAVTEPKSMRLEIMKGFAEREPDFEILGPTKPRAGSSGMILRDGYIVAEWGDTRRVDMTFSAVKSYLSTVAGLALADGLIEDVHDPVGEHVRDGKFASAHNSKITWHHLLQQTSDWQGTLWDTPDWADRPVGETVVEMRNRELHEPGTHFKYNDVRVNLLAYSLLQVWREPLPVVLKERIMDPIGASNSWRWHGYRNSWVVLDGQRMQSVSGGGHFGGGLFISTRDHARFGLLYERQGRWRDRQLFPAGWVDQLRQPAEARSDYGYMWWLNTDQERIPEAPESAYWAAGFGGNYVYVDEVHDLVIVLRWVPELPEVVARVLGALAQ